MHLTIFSWLTLYPSLTQSSIKNLTCNQKTLISSLEFDFYKTTYLTSSGTTSRTTAPVLAGASFCAHVACADSDRYTGWQRQGSALKVIPIAVLQRLRMAASTWQPVQKRGT